jgi:RNA polymerase sigma factor for flagellar operon FliA
MYERLETRDRVRAAIQSLPWRERKVIGLYYYGEVTMKQIGAEIGVNESRVSQLHARAIRRMRAALPEMGPQQVAEMRKAFAEFSAKKPLMAKATATAAAAVVLPYTPGRKVMARAALKVGRQRQAVAAAR